MTRRTTLRDVAQAAGVSVSTASQALNNRPGVSRNVRENVHETAAKLGYRLRVLDDNSSGRLRTVGLVTKRHDDERLSLNPFYAPILAGAEQECQRQNISLMYSSIEVDEDSRALNWPPMLLEQRVDGLIVVGAFLPETITHIGRQLGPRLVLVDGYASSDPPIDSILTDNRSGARSAVEYLVAQGHRHIGLIGSHPHSYPSIRERRAGFIDALSAHQLSQAYIEDSLLDRQDAFEAATRLLHRAPEVTAIFVCNDNTAAAVLSAIQRLGMNCPGDVSVVGFDDIDLAQEITPALTTVHVDKVLMGLLAVRYLRDRVHAPERPTLTTLLGTRLIVRGTVRALVDETGSAQVSLPRAAARVPNRLSASTA
ncbi:MAG TPA: LacI family DNA-binding transcriptional regulator [Candidatus Limnocylindrales bacterium]|nr:LacI family DNA-binding transcriptional regulator [Candidatus Limnocylindrales bacterium]